MTRAESHRTAADLLVLHTLRCIGFASLAGAADAAGLPEAEVESELIDLAIAGLVTRVPGEFGGWGPTEAGRAADAERIGKELSTAGARPVVAKAFEGFLVLNPELLDLCAAWQTQEDSRVLDLFTDFHDRAGVVCAELSTALQRFRRYHMRLTAALNRARSGSPDYLTVSTRSYHAVWFQLHEDLLATLGIPRS